MERESTSATINSIFFVGQLIALVEEAPLMSESRLHRDSSFSEDHEFSPMETRCESRARGGNWVDKLPTYLYWSMYHVVCGTKLNCLLLCVPVAIIAAQLNVGHVSFFSTTLYTSLFCFFTEP